MNARQRSWLSLAGLSVGDAFGDRFFLRDSEVAMRLIAERALPSAPWPYTDDTQMALSIVETLWERGDINQDDLARRYADRVEHRRGYGKGAYDLLVAIKEGRDWRALSQNSFRGMGSFGNGAAMRVASLGAFFADRPLDFISKQAALSSEVTHAHPEGIAGGIAIAVAAALAWQKRDEPGPMGLPWLQAVRDAVPAGYTKDAIDEALVVPASSSIVAAAQALGNGSGITAPDTVPLCLWIAARHTNDFEGAMWRR
jgi:ADP-ribosylglycohydrolase